MYYDPAPPHSHNEYADRYHDHSYDYADKHHYHHDLAGTEHYHDDSELWDAIRDLRNQVDDLKRLLEKENGNQNPEA